MKNWKKRMAMLLALAMCFALAACGNDGGSASDPGAQDSQAAQESSAGTDGELPSDVQAIVDRGVLRVGVKSDVPGFGYQDVLTEEYSGMEIDMAYRIAETLGIDNVEFTAVTAATEPTLSTG